MTNTQQPIDRIYQRHIQAMLATGGDTWCDLAAVRFSLRLALAELAEQLAASPPETATDKLEALILSSQHITELKHALATILDERNAAEAQLAHLDEWLASAGITGEENEVDRAISTIEALQEQIADLEQQIDTTEARA